MLNGRAVDGANAVCAVAFGLTTVNSCDDRESFRFSTLSFA